MKTLTSLYLALPADINNPLQGVTPSIDVFGVKFTGTVGLILGAIWGVALAIIAGIAIWSTVKYAIAKKQARARDIEDAAGDLKHALIAFGLAVGISFILGVIIFFVQKATA